MAISYVEGNVTLFNKAVALANTMQLPHIPPEQLGECTMLLVYTENGLQIQLKHDRTNRKPLKLHVDFLSDSLNYRRQRGGGIKQALARAVGIKPGVRPTILDTTAGLGKDSFLLASLGCDVTMLERSPLLAALLQDGLERAAVSPEIGDSIIHRLALIQCDAITYMNGGGRSLKPDTVYLDPMYPHSNKSALNKQEMRIIRGCVGDDQDSDTLLRAAIQYSPKRVVVKRPKSAPVLANAQPSHTIRMKNSRYDVYMV